MKAAEYKIPKDFTTGAAKNSAAKWSYSHQMEMVLQGKWREFYTALLEWHQYCQENDLFQDTETSSNRSNAVRARKFADEGQISRAVAAMENTGLAENATAVEVQRVKNHLEKRGKAGWESFWAVIGDYGRYNVKEIPKYDAVLKALDDVSAWAEGPTIVYTLTKLKVNFIFFDEKKGEVYACVKDLTKHRRPLLMVLWVDHRHFEPIVQVYRTKKGKEKLRKLFYPSSSVFKTMKQMLDSKKR
jgi:hypothetical protein